MNRISIFALGVFLLSACCAAPENTVTFSVDRIWDRNYCAFPSIEKFKGNYFVTFREGESHVFDKNGIAAGKTRILCSADGKKWESVALLSKEGFDLRDPKLSVMPDGRLMVIMGALEYDGKKLLGCVPEVSFSEDGKNFSEPQRVVFPEGGDFEWFWRLTWHEGTGYVVTYREKSENKCVLLKTVDGINYSTVTILDINGAPNETTLRFLPDGRMALLARREFDDQEGFWGVSSAPFTEWTFRPIGFRIGGPDFILTGENELVAGGRSYTHKEKKMYLWKGDFDGNFRSAFVLPSRGDCSYPGFLQVGDELWVVYYSSHELKNEEGGPRAGIYLAKLPLEYFDVF